MDLRLLYVLLIMALGCLLPCIEVSAQRENPITPQLGSSRQDSVPEGILPLDTFVTMSYVLAGDPDKAYHEKDTFTWEANRQMPLLFHQAYLGNYGSAVRSLTPGAGGFPGFATGWFQYDPYFIHEESFRYYNQDVPVARIRHSQAGQEDTYLTLDFGRSFAEGFNLSVAYRRINQVGEFFHQRQKNTGLGFGLWHHAPSGKYDAFYNIISNVALAEENGGITAPELIGQDLSSDFNIPVTIMGGLTKHNHRIFTTRQILHLTGDTLRPGIDVWLKGAYKSGLYRYSDANAASAAGYYHAQYFPDDRGIRRFTYEKEHQWSLGMSLPWAALHSRIQPSIRYRHIRLDQEPRTRIIRELYLDARGEFQWIAPLVLRGDISLGLAQARGIFSFQAEGILKTGILGEIRGNWSILSRKPYMAEASMYVNQQAVYDADWRNPFVNEIGISWHIEKQKFRAGIAWIVYDNYIWFDSVPLPKQIEGAFSLRRFYVSKGFDVPWAGIHGQVTWQPEARRELAIPTLLYQVSAYGRIRLFDKKVTIIPGADIMYHDGYAGVSYFPVSGVYHLTNGPVIPDYFRVDAGIGLHIRFLKIFARMEDVAGLFKDRILYQAHIYPHYRGYLRLGVEAGFFN